MVKTIYKPISKEEAKLLNLKRYFTGKPCRNDHISERLVSTGHCMQCTLDWSKNVRKKYPEKFKNWYHTNPLYQKKQMLKAARERASKKGVPFSLILEDIEIPEVCPVFKIPLRASRTGWLDDGSPTLDRIEGSKGYVKGNVLVVSWKANRMKNNSSIEDLKTLTEFYTKLTY